MAIFNVAYPPFSLAMVDKDGNITPAWSDYFRSLQNQVGNNFSEKGTHMPTLDNEETIAEPSDGTTFYDNSTDELKVFSDGQFKVIQTL